MPSAAVSVTSRIEPQFAAAAIIAGAINVGDASLFGLETRGKSGLNLENLIIAGK